MELLCPTSGSRGSSTSPQSRISAGICCPIILAIVAICLVFEFASALAGGSTLGGIVLIGLVCFCIYQCQKNKSKDT